MPTKHVFEDTELTISTWMDRGAGARGSASFTFTLTGGQTTLAPQAAEVDDTQSQTKTQKSVATVVTFPLVKDDEDYYDLTYSVEATHKNKTRTFDGVDTYRVWPKNLRIEGTKSDGCAEELYRFPFVISYPGHVETDTYAADDTLLVAAAHLRHPGLYSITALSPYEIKEWTKAVGRIQKPKVCAKAWTAIIRSHDAAQHTEDDPLKQYVNLAASVDEPNNGSLVKIDLGPLDITLARKDQPIKVRATFPKENSQRNEPLPAIWLNKTNTTPVALKTTTAKPGVDDLIYETEVKIPADGAAATLYLQMGYAGGDRCKLEIGVTDTYGDETLYIQNWRQIGFNLVVPDAAIRMPSTLVDGSGFAAALKAQLKRVLDKLFIELFVSTVKVFTLEDLTDYYGPLADGNIVRNKAYFPHITAAGTKVFVGAYNNMKHFRNYMLDGAEQPANTFNTIFCDRMAKVGDTEDKPKNVTEELTKDTATASYELPEGHRKYYQFFKYHPGAFIESTTTPNFAFGVKQIRWRATEYKDGATWKPVENAKPGWAERNWTDVAITSDSIDKYVTFDSAAKVTVKLPAGEAADTLMRAGDGVKIQLDVKFVWPNMGVNGCATPGTGIIVMTTDWGAAAPKGMCRTLTHEMGHNLGHTYFEKKGTRTRGRATAKKIPGVEFGSYVTDDPKGHYYCNNFGHVGAHCCIMPNKPALQTCENFASPTATDKTTHGADVGTQLSANKGCILFGGGDMSDDVNEYSYCADCEKFIRAGNCSSVIDYPK